MPVVTVIDKNGKERRVESEALPYLERMGWREKTTLERVESAEAESKAEYFDTPAQKALTVLEGAGSGASLGLLDPLIDDEETRERASRNPGYRFGGEAVGILAPALTSGGTGFIARTLARSPAGILERGSLKLAEGAVKGKAKQYAVAGAIEGGIGTATQNISNAIMNDPITPEAFTASVGLGTILGGSLGFVGGKIAATLDKKLGKSMANAIEGESFKMDDIPKDAEKASESLFDKEYNAKLTDSLEDAKVDLDQRMARGEWELEDLQSNFYGKRADFEARYGDQKMRALDETDEALMQARKELEIAKHSGNADQVADLKKQIEGYMMVRQIQLDEMDIRDFRVTGQMKAAKSTPLRNTQEVGEGDIVAEKILRDTEMQGPNVTHIDPIQVRIDEVQERLAKQYLARQLLENPPDFSAASLRKMSMKEAVGHSYDFVHRLHDLAPEAASKLDDAFSHFASADMVPAEMLQYYPREALKLSTEALENLGNSSKAKRFAAAWATMKGTAPAKTFQDSSELGEATLSKLADDINQANQTKLPEKALGVTGKRQNQSILTKVAKIAGGRAGSRLLAGSVVGGGVGYALGWGVIDMMLAGGAIAGPGSKLASLSKKMLKQGLTHGGKFLTAQHMQGRALTASQLLSTPYGVGEDENSLRGKSEEELYNLRREQVMRYANGAGREAAAQTLAPLREFSVDLARKLEDDADRKINYLNSALPKVPPWASFVGYVPSPQEIHSFAEVYRATLSPHLVVESLADGTLTPESALALQETNPEFHAAVSRFLLENVDFGKLTYEQHLMIDMFLGTSTNPDIQMTEDYQADFLPEGAEGQAQAQSQSVNGSKLAIQLTEQPTKAQGTAER